MQAKLLRVLEERTFRRVGGTKEITIDVRIISATNQDLLKKVEDKEFRNDLYYRLQVIPIYLAPLRERNDDIMSLVEFSSATSTGSSTRTSPGSPRWPASCSRSTAGRGMSGN